MNADKLAEALRDLCKRWDDLAGENENEAARLAHLPVANELARDGSQYRQSASQVRNILAEHAQVVHVDVIGHVGSDKWAMAAALAKMGSEAQKHPLEAPQPAQQALADTRTRMLYEFDKAREQAAHPVGVPDGWVMVPKRDITSAMMSAGLEWWHNCPVDNDDRAATVACIFAAMRDVAPQPPSSIAGLRESGLVRTSGGVDECVSVPASGAQKEASVVVDVGLDSAEHDLKTTVFARPHGAESTPTVLVHKVMEPEPDYEPRAAETVARWLYRCGYRAAAATIRSTFPPAPQPPVQPPAQPALHPETADLVRRFSAALAEKLAAAEQKYGYSDNWARPGWMDECRQHLLDHVAKGDPRDVAAYCAFLWHHGERTAPAQPSADAARYRKLGDTTT